jgi:hypothetical protein
MYNIGAYCIKKEVPDEMTESMREKELRHEFGPA